MIRSHPIILYGRKTSINVQKVMWALAELGVSVDRRDLGGRFGGLDTPEYRALNPAGLIPTLVDGDIVVTQSNACVRHLASTYPQGGLLPSTRQDRAAADAWMDWQVSMYAEHFKPLFYEIVRTPRGAQDARLVEAKTGAVIEQMRYLNDRLKTRLHLVGDNLSMADVPVGALLFRFFKLPIRRPSLAWLEEYYSRLCGRPGYREHIIVPFDELDARPS